MPLLNNSLEIKFLNILISLLPLTIIVGNLAININIALIIIFGLFFLNYEIFIFKEKKFIYLLLLFFLYLIIITLLKNFPKLNLELDYKNNIIKAFFFFRYFLLFLIINKLIEKNYLNINLFFKSAALFSSLLCLDIFVQVIFKRDIIGYPIFIDQPSGFFGPEVIAGGYLQKFSLFAIFSLSIFFLKKKKFFFIKELILISIFLLAIFLTKNRMPTILFLASILTFFLIEKKLKELLLVVVIFFSITFTLIKFPIVPRIDTYIKVFYLNSIYLIKTAPKLFYSDSEEGQKIDLRKNTEYLLHFNSGIQTWKKNKIFGSGLKSFRLNCVRIKNQTCNTHPHNYLIEILNDVGLLGLILIYTCFFICMIKFYRLWKIQNLNYINIPFLLILLFEFFPVRSSGSFFTTNNATIIFLIFAFALNSKKLIKFK